MSALRPQSLVCTRRVSNRSSSAARCCRQTSMNSGPGSALGPAVVHVVERMIESVEQQVANRPEWGERQMRSRRCLAEQLEEFPIIGDRMGDAFVDR